MPQYDFAVQVDAEELGDLTFKECVKQLAHLNFPVQLVSGDEKKTLAKIWRKVKQNSSCQLELSEADLLKRMAALAFAGSIGLAFEDLLEQKQSTSSESDK